MVLTSTEVTGNSGSNIILKRVSEWKDSTNQQSGRTNMKTVMRSPQKAQGLDQCQAEK